MSSKMYIKKQLISTDGSKVIYPQTKAEIVWREDLSMTVENSLKNLENSLNNGGISEVGTGLILEDGIVSHSNNIEAGTIGDDIEETLSFGSSFNIPCINYDSTGHIQSTSNKVITMPSASVKQKSAITTNGAYPIILAYSTATTEVTDAVNKSSTLTYNPSIKQLYINSGTASTSQATGALRVNGGIGCNGDIRGNAVYGAVFNDYAEFRETEKLKPGLCVCEDGKGRLTISIERLQPGANIISDTFGFAIGETDKCKTPIAVSGRVLAYPYEVKENYNPGDAVCSGPNGTISKMTREEIREYPERIVGTVSEIPTYETWGTENVKVDGRIWIKVK